MESQIKIHRNWFKAEYEKVLMTRLHAIIGRGAPQDNGPFQRDTGYKWQLDSSNDYWAEVRGDTLVLASRYGGDRHKTLVAFVEAWFA